MKHNNQTPRTRLEAFGQYGCELSVDDDLRVSGDELIEWVLLAVLLCLLLVFTS